MAVILRISLNLVNTCVPTHNRVDLWRNLCTSLLYFVVHAWCSRKESSRSLSHLLMSFLFYVSLLTDRQTDRETNGQTSGKTHPPCRSQRTKFTCLMLRCMDRSTRPGRREDREKLAEKQSRRLKSMGLLEDLKTTELQSGLSAGHQRCGSHWRREMAVRLYIAVVNLTLTHVCRPDLQQAAS